MYLHRTFGNGYSLGPAPTNDTILWFRKIVFCLFFFDSANCGGLNGENSSYNDESYSFRSRHCTALHQRRSRLCPVSNLTQLSSSIFWTICCSPFCYSLRSTTALGWDRPTDDLFTSRVIQVWWGDAWRSSSPRIWATRPWRGTARLRIADEHSQISIIQSINIRLVEVVRRNLKCWQCTQYKSSWGGRVLQNFKATSNRIKQSQVDLS